MSQTCSTVDREKHKKYKYSNIFDSESKKNIHWYHRLPVFSGQMKNVCNMTSYDKLITQQVESSTAIL